MSSSTGTPQSETVQTVSAHLRPIDREGLLAFAHETGQTDRRLTPAQVWDGSLMKSIFNFDRTKIR